MNILDKLYDGLADDDLRYKFFTRITFYADTEGKFAPIVPSADRALFESMLDTLIAGTPARSRLAARAWLAIRFP